MNDNHCLNELCYIGIPWKYIEQREKVSHTMMLCFGCSDELDVERMGCQEFSTDSQRSVCVRVS